VVTALAAAGLDAGDEHMLQRIFLEHLFLAGVFADFDYRFRNVFAKTASLAEVGRAFIHPLGDVDVLVVAFAGAASNAAADGSGPGLGDAVREGEQIGTVGDLFGDTLEEIVSPVNGVVLFLTINPSVIENGLLMGIGVE
jgi:hypothetical protein